MSLGLTSKNKGIEQLWDFMNIDIFFLLWQLFWEWNVEKIHECLHLWQWTFVCILNPLICCWRENVFYFFFFYWPLNLNLWVTCKWFEQYHTCFKRVGIWCIKLIVNSGIISFIVWFKMSGNDSCGDATDLYPFIYSMYRVCVAVIYCWRSSLQLQSDSVSVTVESCAVYLVVLNIGVKHWTPYCLNKHVGRFTLPNLPNRPLVCTA